MELTKIKSRYDGECAKCGRELKTNWDIYYDKSNKKVYCTPCGKAIEGGDSADNIPVLLKLTAGFNGECAKCSQPIQPNDTYFFDPEIAETYCENCGSKINESRTSPEKAIKAGLDEIFSNTLLTTESLSSIHQQISMLASGIDEHTDKVVKAINEMKVDIKRLADMLASGIEAYVSGKKEKVSKSTEKTE